jgi:hypothetical protein
MPPANVRGSSDDQRMKSEPTIRSILAEFFDEETAHKRGVIRQRNLAVQTMLGRYLELEGERTLTDPGVAILHAERAFEPNGAFARTMRAEDLLVALTGFLEPPWLAIDPLLRHRQLALTASLVDFLCRELLIDEWGASCFLLETRARIDRAKQALAEERRAGA